MNRVRLGLGAWYFVALWIALMPSKLSTQVSGSPSSQDIDALRAQVKRLQQCWYVAQDELCFWDLVTTASDMRRPENRFKTFHGAFTGKPNPATLKLGFDAETLREIEKNLREVPKEGRPLNDLEADGFVIFLGLPFLTGLADGDAKPIGEMRAEGRLPLHDDFFVALWPVDGEGYTRETIWTTWIRETGQWRFLSFGVIRD